MPEKKQIVINTGPILALIAGVGTLDVFKELYSKIIIPIEVCNEILTGSPVKFGVKEFQEAMDDDLNTPKALQVLWKLVRDKNAKGKIRVIKKIDEVFGLDLLEKEDVKIPKEVLKLVKERETARKKKDWKKADELRDEIKEKGFVVDDTGEGSKVWKK